MVAGDPERMHEAKVVEEGGIWYHDNLITAVVCCYSIRRHGRNEHWLNCVCILVFVIYPFRIRLLPS